MTIESWKRVKHILELIFISPAWIVRNFPLQVSNFYFLFFSSNSFEIALNFYNCKKWSHIKVYAFPSTLLAANSIQSSPVQSSNSVWYATPIVHWGVIVLNRNSASMNGYDEAGSPTKSHTHTPWWKGEHTKLTVLYRLILLQHRL